VLVDYGVEDTVSIVTLFLMYFRFSFIHQGVKSDRDYD